MKEVLTGLVIQLVVVSSVCAQRKPDRDRNGLVGPVKSVQVEMAELTNKGGEWVESPPFMIGGRESYNRKGWGPAGKRPAAGGYGVSHGGHGHFIYDDKGNKAEVIHYSADDQLTGRDFYKYDESGNEIEEIRCSAQGQVTETTIQAYDAKGKRLERAVYSGDGVLQKKWVYKNDERGNIIEEELFGPSGLKERRKFTYEFDAVGNWTKRMSYTEVVKDGQSSFEPEIVTRREVEYHKSRADTD